MYRRHYTLGHLTLSKNSCHGDKITFGSLDVQSYPSTMSKSVGKVQGTTDRWCMAENIRRSALTVAGF